MDDPNLNKQTSIKKIINKHTSLTSVKFNNGTYITVINVMYDV